MTERRKVDWRFTAIYAFGGAFLLAAELFGVFRKAPRKRGGDTITENVYALNDWLKSKSPMAAWGMNVFLLGFFAWAGLHLTTRII